MSDKMQVACPHCNANLKVSLQMQGKVVACPKCKQQFRIGELETPVAETNSGPAFTQPQSFSSGSTDLFSGLGPSQPANSSFDYGAPAPSGQASGAGWGGGGSTVSPYNAPPSRAAKQRTQYGPMSQGDSSCQRAGFFFAALPVMAAVLPFFGLQLKVLAAAGEYACLIAMFFGLIGAGLIFFARRNQPDWIISGLGAGLLVLLFGIGGFVVQGALMAEAEVAEAAETQPNGGFPMPDSAIKDQIARQQAAQADMANQMAENRRRMQRQMAGSGLPAGNNNFSPPVPSGGEANGVSNGKNLFEGELVENGEVISELIQRSSKAISHFMRSNRPGTELETTHTLSNMIGKTSRIARLHDEKPVTSLCVATLGRELLLLPIEESDTQFKYVVKPDAGEQIVGLRMAFDDQVIVGIQGLVQAGASGTPRELPWLGRSTADIQTSMNPSPGESGMVCYSEAGRFVGFAWVERK
jgi:Zn-finger nucleic acid-binding protein